MIEVVKQVNSVLYPEPVRAVPKQQVDSYQEE
jgi:hypothetical protein